MQSIRLLHELSDYTNANRPSLVRLCFIDGEEDAIPIDVKIFPSTSLAAEKGIKHIEEEGELQQQQEEQEKEIEEGALTIGKDNKGQRIKREEENEKKGENSKKNAIGNKNENEEIIKGNIKEEEDDEEEMANENNKEETENEVEEMDDEMEIEYTEEELARMRRRAMFPTETLNEIVLFLTFGDCNRQYTTCRLFTALLEPRRKLCMEVFIKRLDDTRERLNQTIKEVDERRRHVNELTDNIGVINARLAAMGDHLADLDAQIVNNHTKLNELHERIERMRGPMDKICKME